MKNLKPQGFLGFAVCYVIGFAVGFAIGFGVASVFI